MPLTTSVSIGRFCSSRIPNQSEYTLIPPSDCPTNQDHLSRPTGLKNEQQRWSTRYSSRRTPWMSRRQSVHSAPRYDCSHTDGTPRRLPQPLSTRHDRHVGTAELPSLDLAGYDRVDDEFLEVVSGDIGVLGGSMSVGAPEPHILSADRTREKKVVILPGHRHLHRVTCARTVRLWRIRCNSLAHFSAVHRVSR